jgi:hypothetical protein
MQEEIDSSDPHDLFDTSKWKPNERQLSCDICDQKFSNKVRLAAPFCVYSMSDVSRF